MIEDLDDVYHVLGFIDKEGKSLIPIKPRKFKNYDKLMEYIESD